MHNKSNFSYMYYLVQHLGSFGPLRSREHHSLKKLEEEGHLVAGVLAHRHNFDSLKPQHLITVPHVQVGSRSLCLFLEASQRISRL